MPVAHVIVHARAQLAQHEAANTRELHKLHAQAVAAILPHVALLLAHGDNAPVTALVSVSHAVEQHIDAFANHAHVLAAQAQHTGVQLGQATATAQVQALTDGEPQQPDHSALTGLLGVTAAGTALGTLFTGIGLAAAQKVSGVLRRGLSLGEPVKRLFGRVKDALGEALDRAVTVVSDQLYGLYRDASQAVMRANSDVLTGWRWLCDLNGNPCAGCVAMHGSIHDLSEDLDDHIRGHCEQEFLTADSPDIQSGADWFDEQDAEMQQNVLGSKAAYQLYQDGTPLSAFLGVRQDVAWGDSIYTKSTKELVKAGK